MFRKFISHKMSNIFFLFAFLVNQLLSMAASHLVLLVLVKMVQHALNTGDLMFVSVSTNMPILEKIVKTVSIHKV